MYIYNTHFDWHFVESVPSIVLYDCLCAKTNDVQCNETMKRWHIVVLFPWFAVCDFRNADSKPWTTKTITGKKNTASHIFYSVCLLKILKSFSQNWHWPCSQRIHMQISTEKKKQPQKVLLVSKQALLMRWHVCCRCIPFTNSVLSLAHFVYLPYITTTKIHTTRFGRSS